MKTLIILNGECKDFSFLKELSSKVDKIICADGGYIHAKKMNIVPDVVVGDFDSCPKPNDVETVIFPSEKDFNDAEIAIEYALKHFGDDIVLTCALGGRLDHQLFNVNLLCKYNNIVIEENDTKVFCCNDEMNFNDYSGKIVSFLPFGKANITLKGFKYNLQDEEVETGNTLTLSNLVKEDAVVKVNSGKLIAIVCKNNI